MLRPEAGRTFQYLQYVKQCLLNVRWRDINSSTCYIVSSTIPLFCDVKCYSDDSETLGGSLCLAIARLLSRGDLSWPMKGISHRMCSLT